MGCVSRCAAAGALLAVGLTFAAVAPPHIFEKVRDGRRLTDGSRVLDIVQPTMMDSSLMPQDFDACSESHPCWAVAEQSVDVEPDEATGGGGSVGGGCYDSGPYECVRNYHQP